LTTPSSAHRRPKGGSIAIAVHQADGIVSRETVLSCFCSFSALGLPTRGVRALVLLA